MAHYDPLSFHICLKSVCVPTAARKGQKEEDNRGRRIDEDAGEEKVHT